MNHAEFIKGLSPINHLINRAELARRCGIVVQTVHRYFNGESNNEELRLKIYNECWKMIKEQKEEFNSIKID